MKFTVIGAGSWGTTLADLLCENGHSVKIWAREPEVAQSINDKKRNPYFVTSLELSEQLIAYKDIDAALDGSDFALTAIPSGYLRTTIQSHSDKLKKMKGIINVAKGFEQKTGKRLSQVICEVIGVEPDTSSDIVACLSGPNLAHEVGQRKPGASVVATVNSDLGKLFQQAFSNHYFRVYRQNDRTGVELGGTLKNIFAIGAGIVEGMNLGDNAKAAFLTRSLHELVRLGTILGGETQTFYGLAGLGDLMATTSSPLSRNHKLGQAIASGKTFKEINKSTKMVTEGVETARTAAAWGKKLTLELPITEELCRVLFEECPPEVAAENLMSRSLKAENE
ncbi:MAG: NAD(P)H-dependent glycerol-3-phosphate dehydrogenase [Candidatus Rifleibacteriota bacterium]